MAIVLSGTIRDGKVELDDPSAAVDGTKVLVTLPEETQPSGQGRRIYFGMFKEWGDITDEDITAAEYSVEKLVRENGE